jgi:hypothetical protein
MSMEQWLRQLHQMYPVRTAAPSPNQSRCDQVDAQRGFGVRAGEGREEESSPRK